MSYDEVNSVKKTSLPLFKSWTLYSAQGWKKEVNRPLLMAIINATPDSFSDGGQEITTERITNLIKQGADIFDVGGESTRPGHDTVSASDEISRIVPAISLIRRIDPDIPISIDTQKPEVAKAALESGADFINDVSGLADETMLKFVATTSCSAVVMRNKALQKPIIQSCAKQFAEIINRCKQAGIDSKKLILDPGLGFGDLASKDFSALPGADIKTNMQLITEIQSYSQTFPVLIGASRKRFVADLSKQEDNGLEAQTAKINAIAVEHGASIIRTHEVSATRQLIAKYGISTVTKLKGKDGKEK